jgi:circadian clock protein KaiC
LTGSARKAEEARKRREELARTAEVGRRRAAAEQRRRKLMADIEELKAELSAEELELGSMAAEEQAYQVQASSDLELMKTSRRGAQSGTKSK